MVFYWTLIIFRDEEQLFTQCDDPRKFYKEVIVPYKGELELWYMKIRHFTLFCTDWNTAWVVFFPQSALIRSVFRLTKARIKIKSKYIVKKYNNIGFLYFSRISKQNT